MSTLFGTGDQTQDFLNAKQAFYQQSHKEVKWLEVGWGWGADLGGDWDWGDL